MATYYVDGKNGNDNAGNGNSNNPWKSIGKAIRSIKSGDTVKIRTAVYKETFTVTVDNVTLQADDGHQPVIDGGYNEGLFSGGKLPGPEGFLPGGRNASMIRLTNNGTTLDGLTIQNVAGRAIGCSGSRNTIRNCRIDFCYGAGIVINGQSSSVTGTLIENNTVTRCSMMHYDPTRQGGGSQAGTITVVYAENTIVRHNIVAYGYGEGINCGRDSMNMLVEGNVIHTCGHVQLYIQRSKNTVLRNNFVYHLYLKEFLGLDNKAPGGIIIGDESGPQSVSTHHSSGGIIYNNIVVGMDHNFGVRNNSHNYNTQLDDCYIGYNTFVSGRMTRVNVNILGNQRGRPHRRTVFENNIILTYDGSIGRANGDVSGIAFRNNLWSEAPTQAMRGPGDRIGDPRLANPRAPLTGSAPGPSNADPFNYQLTKNSALAIGSAQAGGPVDGFRPPKVERDFFNANRDNNPDLGAHEFGGQAAKISANFSIGPGQQSGVAPHTVDFTDRSESDALITRWSWEFGDGSTSTERNPSHTYMQPGTYTVKLSIVDQNGQQDTLVEPELIAALPEDVVISPESFRRFMLVAEATDAVQAFGVQYPDLTCVLLWNQEPMHVLNYATIDDVAKAFEEPGVSNLVWIDPETERVATANPISLDIDLAMP